MQNINKIPKFRFEEQRDWDSARTAYQRAFTEFGNTDAAEALAKSDKQSGRDLIDLTSDEESDRTKQPKHRVIQEDVDAVARRQRLYELERFKQSLARRVKR
jgi:hypothetical protein